MARTEAEYISALVFHVLDFLAVFETGYQSPFPCCNSSLGRSCIVQLVYDTIKSFRLRSSIVVDNILLCALFSPNNALAGFPSVIRVFLFYVPSVDDDSAALDCGFRPMERESLLVMTKGLRREIDVSGKGEYADAPSMDESTRRCS